MLVRRDLNALKGATEVTEITETTENRRAGVSWVRRIILRNPSVFSVCSVARYLSSSPATTLRPPMMATASASSKPLIISGKAW